MQKKGQAAMEFLMTYGWAILAAVIAIGVLAYFGVFSPGNFIANSCIINSPFGDCEFAIGVDQIEMNIRNGGGIDYTTSNIAVSGCADDTTAYVVVDGGTTGVITIDCSVAGGGTGLASGAKVKKDIVITYTKTTGGTITQTTTGTITGRVP